MAKVYFKYSTMGAGKTALACINAHNYVEQGLTPFCFSPDIDTRFGKSIELGDIKLGKWESRIKELTKEVYMIPTDESIIHFVNNIIALEQVFPDVIMIDEAQFLSRDQVEDLFHVAIRLDIPVICYGLLTTYKTELFEGSKRLIELGAKLEPLKSVGSNGERTVINAKFVNGDVVTDGDDIDIGGDEKYKAMTLEDYWNLLGR